MKDIKRVGKKMARNGCKMNYRYYSFRWIGLYEKFNLPLLAQIGICTVAAHLRAALGNLLKDQNSSLSTVTFGEKVLNLAM